jgi:hypothetical protein
MIVLLSPPPHTKTALCSARRDPTGGDIARTKRREVRTEGVAHGTAANVTSSP